MLRTGLGEHHEHYVDHNAQAADRNKVPAEVICVDPHEVASDSGDGGSSIATSDSGESSSETLPPRHWLQTWGNMRQTAYKAVGLDFEDKEELIGPEYHKLLKLEAVPRRWPLARLSIPLQKIVDRIDRVLAGCCWEAFATRSAPEESLPSIKQASKRLTMLLAGYLAKEVAAILREIMTHPTKQLYDENTVHLLCSNYWLQPIYQELLRSSSRYNATVTGEKNRPCSGLGRVSAHPRPPKSATATRFRDWIRGMCYADTLQVWFPAHWPPLSFVGSNERRMNTGLPIPPGWIKTEVPDDLRQKWHEAQANRRMQFKVGTFRSSEIRMLTCTLKADWIQLPVENYLAVFPTLKQGVVAGCSKSKVPLLGRSPEQRSYKYPCFCPINSRWTTGIQRSMPMPCPRCGLMYP